MARVRARLFNILTAISLVMCLATIFWWIVTFPYTTRPHYDFRLLDRRGEWLSLKSQHGTVSFAIFLDAQNVIPGPASQDQQAQAVWRSQFKFQYKRFHFAGISAQGSPTLITAGNGVVSMYGYDFGFRLWHLHLILLFGILPIYWYVRTKRLHRRHRALLGLCAGCGYDLRATQDRCPECGLIPEPKSS